MNNPFTSFNIYPDFLQGHVLQWVLDPVFIEDEPHIFTVEISGTPTFELIDYTLPAGENVVIRDKTNTKQDHSANKYYRVKLTTGADKTYYSPLILFGIDKYTRRQYVIASEIVRKELLRMRKFTGSKGWLLKRKVVGTPMKQLLEVDPVSGVALTDNTSHQGTSLEGGYYPPIGFYFSTERTAQARKLSEFGMTEIYSNSFRTVGFPSIDSYDIIVDSDTDDRWIIKDLQPFPFPGTDIIVVQTMEVQLIPNTDPVYKIATPKITDAFAL